MSASQVVYTDCDYCAGDNEPWSIEPHEQDCQWFDALADYAQNMTEETEQLALTTGSPSKWQSYWKASDWSGGFTSYRSCTHASEPYALLDGTVVYVSAHADRSYRKFEPDLAVYLDGSWKPACVAFHVGWPDYGLPLLRDSELALVARTALDAARDGKRVEIGCIGAHGRTGTFLAYLEVMASPSLSGAQAVSRVRMEHCHKAIETDDQEWSVTLFAAHVRGEETPRSSGAGAHEETSSETREEET